MPFQSRAQKEYLRINEPEIYERWMREYDAESNQSFTPPAAAVAAAKKGLAQRKKWGRGGLSPAEAKSQGIDSGVTRARKIASGKVSRHDVRRMSAFNRHRKNNNPSKKMPDGGPTAGTIAWNLWGGSAGVNWAKKKSAAMNAESFDAETEGYCDWCERKFDDGLYEGDNWWDGEELCLNCYQDVYSDFGDVEWNAESFESPVSCKICGKTFDSFRGLNGHMNAHLPPHRKRAEMPALTGEDELKTYQVSVPVLHYYGIGPVEAYDEDEAADEVRNNWRSHWRHTIEDNGDWGGPLWRYSPLTSHEPEAYEIFASETFGAEGNTQWDKTLAMINQYDMRGTEGSEYSYSPEGKHKNELPPFFNKELVDKNWPKNEENIALIMDYCGDGVRSNGTYEGTLYVGPNISEETVVKQLQDWGIDTSNHKKWKNFGYFSNNEKSRQEYPELKIYQFPIPNTSLCQWSNAYVRDTEYDDDGTAYTTFGQDCIKCNSQRRGTLGGDVSWDKNAESFGPVDEDGILAKALAQARAKSKEPRRPLKITKLPHQDQTSLKDFEAETKELPFSVSRKDIALVSFGAILGVVSGVIGEVLAEFWLDRYRRDPELVSSGDDENA